MECEWIEFKENNDRPETIGENIAAVANSARLVGEPFGYMVWGIRDSDHKIVGTSADPAASKVGNSELRNWLETQLSPALHFEFDTVQLSAGPRVVVLTIVAASHMPVKWKGTEFVRVGSYTKKLAAHSEYARRLWRSFDEEPFELSTARDRLTGDNVLQLID